MYKDISDKQAILYGWRSVESFNDCETLVATGAIRTGKTEISSWGFEDDAIQLVRDTPKDYRTKGYNLFAMISTTKALALLNMIEPAMAQLEEDGYLECKTVRQFYRAKGNVFVHSTHPMGLLQVKDYYGNVTRFLYIGADNKRALIKVTGLTLRGWFLDEAPLLAGNEDDNMAFIQRMYERTATFRTEPYGRPLQVMTTNPQTGEEGKFYQTYIKGGRKKRILVLSFHMLDNPIFSQKDVDYYRDILTPNQFARKIEGKWVRDNSVATYPKFNRKRHVKPFEEVLGYDFCEFNIGLDEGQSDARAFVLQGFTRNYDKNVYIDEYYYKNAPGKIVKDINDYVVDFWDKAQEWYGWFGRPMTVRYDSAALYIVEPLKRYKIENRINIPVVIKPVNKSKAISQEKGKGTAIKERVDFNNILLGSDNVVYSDKCEVLIDATIKCENENGMRIDKKDHPNNIDILDASEYGPKHRLKLMWDRIMLKGAGRGVREQKTSRRYIIGD